MAVKPRFSTFWLFVVRLAGLTGALFLAAGALVLLTLEQQPVGAGFLVAGGLLVLFWLVVECIAGFEGFSNERTTFGANVLMQVVIAALLLAGINAFAFDYYGRFDLTRERQFTIPPELKTQLAGLRADVPTTIVVHLRHVEFGASKPDNFDSAAERKVVEKVKDLVEQFRELGPRFQVTVLDVQEEGYSDKLARVTKGAKVLRDEIERFPENSVFFYTDGKVQRLAFHDIFQLDKRDSRDADDGKGNLVLRYQGMEPFARRVLNAEEPRPKVAIGVVHELLGTEGSRDSYTLKGLRDTLANHRIEVRDLILKKWGRPTEPAVYTYDESRYTKLAEKIEALDAQEKSLEQQRKLIAGMTPKELADRRLTQKDREQFLARLDGFIKETKEQTAEERKKQQALQVARIEEQQRIRDLKAKMARNLADCDLLILTRQTLENVAVPFNNIPAEIHNLDRAQVDAIKDFIKAGKPVLVVFGSVSSDPEEGPPQAPPDGLEAMLGELGLRLGSETVLYDSEVGALAELQAQRQAAGGGQLMIFLSDDVKVPPVSYRGSDRAPPNRVGESLNLAARRLNDDQFALRLRNPRPVEYLPPQGAPEQQAAFLWSDAASWVEEQPFPTDKYLPRLDEKKRRGPVALAVAAETVAPAAWYASDESMPGDRRVRVAAIGQGGVFTGNTLPLANEKLLLDVTNWLLGRDDLLTRGDNVWEYPRLDLSERQLALWQWGAWLGLPAIFIYLGMVVLLVRRLR